MKNIYENNITSISTDSENPNFPIDRVYDEHPKRVYKAVNGVQSVTLSIGVVSGFNSVIFAGTNIESITMKAINPNEIAWGVGSDWGGDNEWGGVDVDVQLSEKQRSFSRALWVDVEPDINTPVNLECVCTTSEDTLEIGIIRANIANDFADELNMPIDPDYGLQESRVDYSIIDENSNGSQYYKKRDIVRSFDINMLMSRSAFYDLMESYDTNGQDPTGWKVTDIDSNQWVVFAKFDGQPVGSFDHYNYSNVSFTLVEVL